MEIGRILADNRALVLADSIAIGIVSGANAFLPVFLVRLGASGAEVGLLSALPGIAGVVLAIPIGRWLQRRPNIVPWYSRSRFTAQLGFAGMALAAIVAPASWRISAVLLVWALATIPNTMGQVAFPIVMDGASDARGRYDLVSQRWSTIGIVATITVVVAGQLLGALPFPLNYELLFCGFSLAGVASFVFTRRIQIPDQRPTGLAGSPTWRARIADLGRLVQSERSFTRYELRALFFTAGIGLAAPLLSLYYIREAHAPDNWIGIIGACQSAGTLVGYVSSRRLRRRLGGRRLLLAGLLLASAVPVTLSMVLDLRPVARLATSS